MSKCNEYLHTKKGPKTTTTKAKTIFTMKSRKEEGDAGLVTLCVHLQAKKKLLHEL